MFRDKHREHRMCLGKHRMCFWMCLGISCFFRKTRDDRGFTVQVPLSAVWDTVTFESYIKAIKIIPGLNTIGQLLWSWRCACVKKGLQCGLPELKVVKSTSKTDRNRVLMLARRYKIGEIAPASLLCVWLMNSDSSSIQTPAIIQN